MPFDISMLAIRNVLSIVTDEKSNALWNLGQGLLSRLIVRTES
jgi:hypothetical protein